ncbi:uncharacterized protein LOC141655545 [Silene latifolia]|uniref:uncharacterized protein LOC141655545 n=1 Tax=Silene latifolia TaxID=37657 RepID=UPI003D78B0A7
MDYIKTGNLSSIHAIRLPYQRLYVAVANDEKDEFMKLIKDPGFQQVRHYFTAKQIFERDALEIATAVFNGETKNVVIGLEDLLKPELTTLHLAAKHRAPRLTHYLLQRGAKADHIALDFSTNIIVPGGSLTILDLLWRVCFHNRDRMEVTRILVQSTQNKTWARDAFMEYAMNGDLHKVVALFLAVLSCSCHLHVWSCLS